MVTMLFMPDLTVSTAVHKLNYCKFSENHHSLWIAASLFVRTQQLCICAPRSYICYQVMVRPVLVAGHLLYSPNTHSIPHLLRWQCLLQGWPSCILQCCVDNQQHHNRPNDKGNLTSQAVSHECHGLLLMPRLVAIV